MRNFEIKDTAGTVVDTVRAKNKSAAHKIYIEKYTNNCENIDFSNLDVRGFKFRNVCTTNAKFDRCIWPRWQIPQNKELKVYKKTKMTMDGYYVIGVLVTLIIPKDAKRTTTQNSYSKKCRANEAVVIKMQQINVDRTLTDLPEDAVSYSFFSPDFTYRVGQKMRPNPRFSFDLSEECDPGIHFFRSKKRAMEFVW